MSRMLHMEDYMEQVPFSLSLYIGENLIIMILSNDDNDGVSGDDDDDVDEEDSPVD